MATPYEDLVFISPTGARPGTQPYFREAMVAQYFGVDEKSGNAFKRVYPEANPVIAALEARDPNFDLYDALLTLDSKWANQFDLSDQLEARDIIEDRIEAKHG